MKKYELSKRHFNLAIEDVTKYGNQLDLQAEIHLRLADIAGLESKPSENILEIDKSRKLTNLYLKTVLPGLPPKGQQEYLQKYFTSAFRTSLSFGFHAKKNSRAAFASAEWLINGKGLGQEVAAETALLAAPETAPFVQELRGLRDEIARLWIQDPQMSRKENRERLAELEAKEKGLQQEINKRTPNSSRGNDWVTVGELMSRLPSDAAIINVSRVPILDFTRGGMHQTEEEDLANIEFRYVAWVIPYIANGTVQIVDLGDADEILELLSEFKASIVTEGSARSLGIPKQNGRTNQKKTEELTKKLSKLLVAPLEPHLVGTKKIFLSPDGALWEIPWDAPVSYTHLTLPTKA